MKTPTIDLREFRDFCDQPGVQYLKFEYADETMIQFTAVTDNGNVTLNVEAPVPTKDGE